MTCTRQGRDDVDGYVGDLTFDDLIERRNEEGRINRLDGRPSSKNLAAEDRLYLPGRITHIVRRHRDNLSMLIRRGVSRDDYDQMLVSSHMFSDHFCGEMLTAIDNVSTRPHLPRLNCRDMSTLSICGPPPPCP